MTTPLDSPELTHSTLIESDPRTFFDEGDHDKFAHYVRENKVVESAVTGCPVVALCGKVWVPTRDPDKFPMCPECKTIHAGLSEYDRNYGD